MGEETNFTQVLEKALSEKTEWYNSTVLPEMLDSYRLLHTCVKNLYDLLVKRSLITPDPYKLDKKISDITLPDDSPFIENERAMVMGARFSDYESMLDFLCTYFKFSVEHIDITQIKKLVELNGAFQWDNMSSNNSKTNTRGLAQLLNEARQHGNAMSISLINDSIAKSAQSVIRINSSLKNLTDFEREAYKGQLRKDLFEHPAFNRQKAAQSAADEMAEIRRIYPEVMGKKPFYGELIGEIVREDHDANKAQLQSALLAKLQVVDAVHSEKTKKKIDTKDELMDVVRVLAAVGPQYAQILEKINSNFELLESEENTFFDKLRKLLRKAFNLPEPEVEYTLTIVDQKTENKSFRKIVFNTFYKNLLHREKFYTACCNRGSVEYQKIASAGVENILTFVNKQISEAQETLVLLNALDDFFKSEATLQDKEKVKGMKIELVTIKNTVVKANQKRAEYTASVEEELQMKKLGIEDEE